MKMKLNNVKGKVAVLSLSNENSLQHPCRTFILTYVIHLVCMNHKKLKLCQVQQAGEKAMIRNLCNRIPLTSPVTITKISNDNHRNTTGTKYSQT